MLEVTNRPSINSFMLQKTAVDTFNSNLPDIAKVFNDRLKSRYPRNIGGWLVTYENSTYTQIERDEALRVISRQDPYVYFCYLPDPVLKLRQALETLSSVEKYKLALGWGLTGKLNTVEQKKYSLASVTGDELLAKLRSFCGY